jgi:hypothetical protein
MTAWQHTRVIAAAAAVLGFGIVTGCGMDDPPREPQTVEASAAPSPTANHDDDRYPSLEEVGVFLAAWSDAENRAAFEAFEAERQRLGREEAERANAGQADAARRTQTGGVAAPATTASGGSCVIPAHICARESGFDYQAVNASSGAGGMYQFLPSTWNAVAAQIAPEWIGTPPQLAPPAVQDQFAAYLWDGGAGCSHWGCG